jgi:hypothetical protein
MESYKTHLDKFREYYPEISSKLEKMFGVSMEGVKFRPMTKMGKDLVNKSLEDSEDLKDKKIKNILKIILGFKLYKHKKKECAVVFDSLPKNIYVNTYFPKILRSKKEIKYIAAHELGHVMSYLICPDFFKEIKKDEEKKNIGIQVLEGITEYLTPKLLKKTEYSYTARIRIFAGNLSPGYNFVKEVCDKKGIEFIEKILNNPPKDKNELKNPELYLNRIN